MKLLIITIEEIIINISEILSFLYPMGLNLAEFICEPL